MQQSWLECIRGCGKKYSIYDVIYNCENCGGLLDVQHNIKALQRRSASSWKKLFDDRTRTNKWPYASGVWGKKEWVCPQLDNENVVSMYEGHTNCFWAERLGKEIGDAQALLESADKAMYKAKREGRNQVFVNKGATTVPPLT